MGGWEIRRVQHVSITRPRGSAEQARQFYGEVLGLREIPVPATLRGFDLVWYQLGTDELHVVGEENADNSGSGRHFCVEVVELEALRQRLLANDVAIHDATPIPGRPRFFCTDPFGNGIEFTELHGYSADAG